MSITYHHGNPAEIISLAPKLTRAHWDEASFDLGFDLALSESAYDDAHQRGIMHSTVAKVDGRIIGYAVYYVCQHNFNPDATVAVSEALYVHPAYRGRTCAARLIRFAETHAQQLGASVFSWHCRAGTSLDAVFARRGYEQTDIVMSRRL